MSRRKDRRRYFGAAKAYGIHRHVEMAHNGVRKRLKVRWMREVDDITETAHAFLILTGGTLRDYAMCGLKLGSMHRWVGDRDHRTPCHNCKLGMGKGGRA